MKFGPPSVSANHARSNAGAERSGEAPNGASMKQNDDGEDHPTSAADALETVERLLCRYVPPGTSDAAFAVAAVHVLRRELSGTAGVPVADGGKPE